MSARGSRSTPCGEAPLLSARSLVPGVKLSARGIRQSPSTPRVGTGTPRVGDPPSARCRGPEPCTSEQPSIALMPLSSRLSEHSSASESSSENLVEDEHEEPDLQNAVDYEALRNALAQ